MPESTNLAGRAGRWSAANCATAGCRPRRRCRAASGVGLGLAVLIDATVIRGVLLPATMKLLGEWNWYMPRSLEWVPRLTPEERKLPLRPLSH